MTIKCTWTREPDWKQTQKSFEKYLSQAISEGRITLDTIRRGKEKYEQSIVKSTN